ncbi:MAG: hypothetical protein C0520_02015 [Sphingopyxis sp.]|nr:hypothetical protein [Sphingopyxis sp.]
MGARYDRGESEVTASRQNLPALPSRSFDPIGHCIYCGCEDILSTEHVIPYAAGGTWTLPKSSCRSCSVTTGRFEGEFSRSRNDAGWAGHQSSSPREGPLFPFRTQKQSVSNRPCPELLIIWIRSDPAGGCRESS